MPYRRAWLWVTVLFVLTVPAFWRNYLGQLGNVEWQLHFHGATAALWVLLVVLQSYSIHHGHRSLHRRVGAASMVLVPPFVAGGLLVVSTMALRPGPFMELFGARLAAVDMLSVIAFAAFIFLALKQRRNVGLHGGWMLATVFPLINPTLARLFPVFVPGLTIRSAEELPRFAGSVHLAQTIGMAIALYLFLRYRRHGTPMLVVFILLAVQSLLFETAGRSAWWAGVHELIGAISPFALVALGMLLGAIVVATGWTAGSKARK